MEKAKRTFKVKTNKREFTKTIEISAFYSEHGYPDYDCTGPERQEDYTILQELGKELKISEAIVTYELIVICPNCKFEITRGMYPSPECQPAMIENMIKGNEGYCPRCDHYIEYNK